MNNWILTILTKSNQSVEIEHQLNEFLSEQQQKWKRNKPQI